jgi:hypothetical protein
MSNTPNHVTHVPVKVEIPGDDDFAAERAVFPTPSLWQAGVKVRHRRDANREAIVRHVDYKTNQFRPVGGSRTTWENCMEWDPLVEPSPQEKERVAALEKLQAEMASLGPDDLAAVQVLVDDPDPSKALAKLEAMRRLGIIGKAAASTGKK